LYYPAIEFAQKKVIYFNNNKKKIMETPEGAVVYSGLM
jgi:hypothetical protein